MARDLQQSINLFTKVIVTVSETVKIIRNLISDRENVDLSDQDLRTVHQLHQRLITVSGEYFSLRDDIHNFVSYPVVEWCSKDVWKVDMTFCSGQPWEFYVTYGDPKKWLEMNNSLREMHGKDLLRKFTVPPSVGQYVVCLDGNDLLRGLILNQTDSQQFSILVIDVNNRVLVNLDDIFEIPHEIAAIPCQIIKCCVNEEENDFKSFWCSELDSEFNGTLAKSALTVDVLKKLTSSDYPLFLVRTYMYNDEFNEDINLVAWLNRKLVARSSPVQISNVSFVDNHRCSGLNPEAPTFVPK